MPQHAKPGEVLRPTQSFVSVVSYVKQHPSLVALEVAWRWAFGIPACLLVWHFGSQALGSVPWQATGVLQVSANDMLTRPEHASTVIAQALLLVEPPVMAVARWLAPLLIVAWTAIAALGRTLLLKRIDPSMHARPGTLFLLNLLRLVPMLGTAWLWWATLSWVAQRTVLQSDAQMMTYVAAAIGLTLGLVVVWAIGGWAFTAAPLLAMRQNLNAWSSLREALRLRALRMGLVEINLVLGIVRMMLLVLLVAFSATPLPFQSELTGDFLTEWTLAMSVLYFLASDFFHVARLAGYLELGREAR